MIKLASVPHHLHACIVNRSPDALHWLCSFHGSLLRRSHSHRVIFLFNLILVLSEVILYKRLPLGHSEGIAYFRDVKFVHKLSGVDLKIIVLRVLQGSLVGPDPA